MDRAPEGTSEGREMEMTYFFNRVSEHTTRAFINDYHVGGIIVGGPGPTKENFLKGGYLDYRLQKNVIEVIDTSYSGREGIREIVEKASDKLQNVRLIEEKKLVQRFLAEVSKPNGLGVYGLPRVIDALNRNNIETILVFRRPEHVEDHHDLQELSDRQGEGGSESAEDSGHAGDALRTLPEVRFYWTTNRATPMWWIPWRRRQSKWARGWR